MYEDTIDTLQTLIVNNQFLNGYARNFSPDEQELTTFLTELKLSTNRLQVHVDIREFKDCNDEESEAETLLAIIKREVIARNIEAIDFQAINISSALQKWGGLLENRTLIVFQCFNDPFSEKEKNILRSLRKALRDKEDISGYLGILIISTRPVSKWVLLPESNLDERCLELVYLKSG